MSATGPASGLPDPLGASEPQLITRWPTDGPRKAFVVPPFRPAQVVPGLRTRRMDRLSAWALLGSVLALRDAGIEAEALDGDRTAVVFGTAHGCLELTQEFLGAISDDADVAPPIVFPETLANLPASHIAHHFGIHGPNLTVSAGFVSGEAALLQALSLISAGEADRVLLLAGDVLSQALYEWYEVASLLAPACLGESGVARAARRRTIVPGEGLAACVLEASEGLAARQGKAHGRYHAGWLGSLPESGERPRVIAVEELLRQMLGGSASPEVTLMTPTISGPSWLAKTESTAVRSLPGRDFGEFGGSGLLQLGVALGQLREAAHELVMTAGPSEPDGQVAALLVARQDRP